MSDNLDIERLKRSSKRGIIASIVGVLIVLAGFAFSGLKLAEVNAEIQKLQTERDDRVEELDSLDEVIFTRTQELNNTMLIYADMKELSDSLLNENKKKNAYQLMLNQAVDSAAKGNFDAAVKLYTELLHQRSDDWKVRQFRGYAYYRLGNYAAARADLEEVLKMENAEKSDALFSLILVEAQNDHLGAAVQLAAELKKEDPSAFNLLKSSVPSTLRSDKKFVELTTSSKTRH